VVVCGVVVLWVLLGEVPAAFPPRLFVLPVEPASVLVWVAEGAALEVLDGDELELFGVAADEPV
jgi:hypothetical protein